MREHAGHEIVIVDYAGGENVAMECEDCNEVLHDADRGTVKHGVLRLIRKIRNGGETQ